MSEPETRVLDLLRGLPGVKEAVVVPPDLRRRAVENETRHERSSVLPVRNLGLRILARRSICVAILKDASFRPPGVPTVYLVEEGAPQGCPHLLVVDGLRYAVVGEEVVEGHPPYDEPTIPLDRSFVIFPRRRSGAQVPCLFVLPPIPFPELERECSRLGIREVVSISPSLSADGLLREAFGFPPTNDLATLLVGCDPAPAGFRSIDPPSGPARPTGA